MHEYHSILCKIITSDNFIAVCESKIIASDNFIACENCDKLSDVYCKHKVYTHMYDQT